MIAWLFLGVALLLDPGEAVDAAAAAAVSADADRVEIAGAPGKGAEEAPKSIRVTSRTSDFDRTEGVVLFEGDVVVRYAEDCTMCADRLYMFLAGSNELSRVVAVGGVSITNDARVGTCAMATYRRRRSEVEMFGDGERPARLVDGGESAGALEGGRIRFWLDTEQVEVVESSVSVKRGEGGGLP